MTQWIGNAMEHDRIVVAADRVALPEHENRFVRICILHGNRQFRNGVVSMFSGADCVVEWAADLQMLRRIMHSESFDLLVLEASVVSACLRELIGEIRALHNASSCIFVCDAEPCAVDRAGFLEAGADDVISAPVDPREFKARVHALVGRSLRRRDRFLSLGRLELDCDGLVAYVDSRVFQMTAREWKLGVYFAMHPNRTLSFASALEMLSFDGELSDNALAIIVCRFRSKVRPHGVEIISTRGMGYSARILDVDKSSPARLRK